MSEQSGNNGKGKKIAAEVKQYIEKRVELLSLNIAEQVSYVIAESFQRMAGLVILGFGIFFFWFAVGFFLAEIIGSISLGFLLASIPLFIAGFVFMNRKSKSVTEKVQARLIGKVLDSLEKENEPEKIEGETIEQK